MSLRALMLLNILTVSILCLGSADAIEASRSARSYGPNVQYHIQTDEGPERFFRYQTLNGQYRKEKRLADGTVIGTEGWLDPLGYLRLKDYIADHEGFRILRSKMVFVGKDTPIHEAMLKAKKVPPQGGILARPRRPPNPFRRPQSNDVSPITGNDIRSGYYTPTTIRPSIDSALPPYTGSSRNDYYRGRNRGAISGSVIVPSVPPVALQTLDTYYDSNNKYTNDNNANNDALQPISRILQVPASSPYDVTAAVTTADRTSAKTSYRSPTATIRNEGNVDDGYPTNGEVHQTANGFQYYLRRHYHEEEREPSGESVGSFGYIDPFGIRRVIYYKTDPYTGGFQHRKNNRYVGFSAKPYDSSPDAATLRNRRTISS